VQFQNGVDGAREDSVYNKRGIEFPLRKRGSIVGEHEKNGEGCARIRDIVK
jgi:hypothetical protein